MRSLADFIFHEFGGALFYLSLSTVSEGLEFMVCTKLQMFRFTHLSTQTILIVQMLMIHSFIKDSEQNNLDLP